jgi:small subunit ribosomal protein S8
LEYAEFVLENWLTKAKFLELKRRAGRKQSLEGGLKMSVTDPIADMLTRIRNALVVKHEVVEMPSSKMKVAIAEILEKEGYIKGFSVAEDKKQGVLKIKLKYTSDRQKVITGLKRISRPGLRVYAKKDEVPKVLGGIGVAIISTSTGIVTDKEARKIGTGGEVLCYIW